MSGHITSTSRGSRVGSSASSPSSTSRSTSTCRARPWQACTCRLRSPAASGGRVVGAVAERCTGRRVVAAQVVLQAAQQRGRRSSSGWWCRTPSAARGGEHQLQLAGVAAERRQQRVRHDGRPSGRHAAAGRSGDRARRRRAPTARPRGAAATGARRGARPARRARATWSVVSRVGPNSDSRCGRSPRAGSARSAAHAASSRSAGLGVPTQRAQPPPQLGLPAEVVGQRPAEPVGVVARRASRAASRAGARRRSRTARPGAGPPRTADRAPRPGGGRGPPATARRRRRR